MSARWRLTLSYAGFLTLAGVLLLAVVWVFLLRYVPDGRIDTRGGFVPNRSDLLQAFAPAAVAALCFLLGLGLIGGWVLAGRMLAPLQRLTRATRIAAGGTLSHRIRLEGRRDEFGELADAFDAMLAQLEEHVAAQQRFAANASHELRTPLAITQAVLDVARRDPTRDRAADLDRLDRLNSRAIALTEALLLLSRIGKAPLHTRAVDLSLFAEEATETVLPLAEQGRVGIEVDGTSAVAHGEPTLLLQAVTNLVHNAVVHNHADGGVTVSTGRRGRTAWLVVENSGPVLDPGLVATLTEPFQRGSERRRTGAHDGAGLGLAIVSRIVEVHHGRLTLTAREAGGLHVRVDLPLEAGAGAGG
ncbi:HAMP domain-containing histidine kinase [Ruania suaedae]|uniref:sensor histidine kinase n=1 Tax=Ruania suaedae TaxID=2897774 RepID=UPI001E2D0B78|nr:HAMP domain-containing sensor histidine kinase [Ruania suaedae]UFU01931.1 HAMP domain-containing histidine kinase [Ruania suaedae]